MDGLPNIPPPDNNLKIKEEPEEEEDSDNLIDEEEEEDDDENNDKNDDNNDDSLSLDIDEDRYTLPQIREFLKKKRLKTEKRSLLPKKPNAVQNITYNANTKTLLNCFIPDLNQLKDFLDHCVVKEIKEDEPSLNIKQEKKDVFDPEEFMLNNGIIKGSLSVEDLSLVKKNSEVEKMPDIIAEKPKPNPRLINPIMENNESIIPSIYKSKEKINQEKLKEQYMKIRKIMNTSVLSLEQKRWLSEFIKNTNELPLEAIIEPKKKFEIVFDLDNTCIFSYICNGGQNEGKAIQSKYNYKNIKMFEFTYDNKYMYSILIIRQGLKEFVEYVKNIANFHISTLAAKSYGEQIVKTLEQIFNIKFTKFTARNSTKKVRKYLEDLNTDDEKMPESQTIIFDDTVNVWEKDCFNVIASKKFYDRDIQMTQLEKKKDNKKNDLDIFLDSFTPYSFNQFKEIEKNERNETTSWRIQNIINKERCPFYIFKNKNTPNYNDSYFAEYFNSPKYQFIYMKNVIKVLYCLVFYNDLNISDAIKLVRLNTLFEKKFYLRYLTDEQKRILSDIIGVCGGEIYYSPIGCEENILDLTKKVFLVVSKRQYAIHKEEINIELKQHNNFVMINEKFILDSYYFMTDLGDSYKDKEYTDFDDLDF